MKTYTDSIRKLLSEGELWICQASENKYAKLVCKSQRKSLPKLAEKTNLSLAYIGMIERGEKIPKLETFIRIINTLEISADVVLQDVLVNGYQVRMSRYLEKMDQLSK